MNGCHEQLAKDDGSDPMVDFKILQNSKEIYEAMKDLLMSHEGDKKYRDRARNLISRIEGTK